MSILFGLLFARRFYCRSALSFSPGRTGGLLPRINAPKKQKQHTIVSLLFWRAARDTGGKPPCVLGDRREATVPASHFATKNSSQDCFLNVAHPLRVRIPQKFIKKREAIPKYHFSFGALQGIQAASRLACSATVALRQYPPHTSRLKTVHRTVFLTPLTLSGFESLNKKTEATQNCIASVLARCKGFEPLTFWFVAKHSIQLS